MWSAIYRAPESPADLMGEVVVIMGTSWPVGRVLLLHDDGRVTVGWFRRPGLHRPRITRPRWEWLRTVEVVWQEPDHG